MLGHPQRGVPAYAAIEGRTPMSGYNPKYKSGAPRAVDLVDGAPEDLLPRCPNCSELLEFSILSEEGATYRREYCPSGHHDQRERIDDGGRHGFGIRGP